MTGPDQEDDQQVPDGEYASCEEATVAIHALTPADHVKLMVLASAHWKQRNLRETMRPEELLGEAVLRTIAPGKRPRRWRKAVVSMIEHLDRTMESISGHAVGSAVAEAAALEGLRSEEIDPRTSEPRRFHQAVAERGLIAREQLRELERCFEAAPQAFALLRLKAAGYEESEIMQQLGMDKRTYEAARKKAERVVASFVLRGGGEGKS